MRAPRGRLQLFAFIARVAISGEFCAYTCTAHSAGQAEKRCRDYFDSEGYGEVTDLVAAGSHERIDDESEESLRQSAWRKAVEKNRALKESAA